MTDRDAIAADHRAVVASGVGNTGLARYIGSAEVTWRRIDALGEHAEIEWTPGRNRVEHVLVTTALGDVAVYRL